MAASPVCTVKDGASVAQGTANGVDVTPGNLVTIQLASLAGADVWTLTIVGQDELVVAPTLTLNNATKTATFTAPALPWSLIFRSTVQSAGDTTVYATTFKICARTSGGARLGATNETSENDATFGWVPIVNAPVRSSGGSYGAFASRPAAGIAGRQYFTSDGPVHFLDDGAAWRPIIGGTIGTAPPAAATWATVNVSTGATFADYKGGLQFTMTNGTSGLDVRLAKRTGGTAHWKATMHCLPCQPAGTAGTPVTLIGIGARNSANGNVVLFSYQYATTNLFIVHRLTASSAGATATYTQSTTTTVSNGQLTYAAGVGFWFRVSNDGTNLAFFLSTDGINFAPITSELLSFFISAADELVLHLFYSDATQKTLSCVYDSLLIESLP